MKSDVHVLARRSSDPFYLQFSFDGGAFAFDAQITLLELCITGSRYDQDLWINFSIVRAIITLENVRSVQRRRFPRHHQIWAMYRKQRERERENGGTG